MITSIGINRVHCLFVFYGLLKFLRKRLERHFSLDKVLQLLDRFYNLELPVKMETILNPAELQQFENHSSQMGLWTLCFLIRWPDKITARSASKSYMKMVDNSYLIALMRLQSSWRRLKLHSLSTFQMQTVPRE
ncbi:uncharacterized protein LOC111318290 isoform X2 [Durio zibethinus]|uniref:Uncharacterized protein LOC111318290 isoform X2 n=1 Tax=Durio zibethinus TaxID=66656 RepID=A0A6P6BI58_DURZI|nr:uncharacterized protein LOC111318290 isoform X2 [Durio zibethinus]